MWIQIYACEGGRQAADTTGSNRLTGTWRLVRIFTTEGQRDPIKKIHVVDTWRRYEGPSAGLFARSQATLITATGHCYAQRRRFTASALCHPLRRAPAVLARPTGHRTSWLSSRAVKMARRRSAAAVLVRQPHRFPDEAWSGERGSRFRAHGSDATSGSTTSRTTPRPRSSFELHHTGETPPSTCTPSARA